MHEHGSLKFIIWQHIFICSDKYLVLIYLISDTKATEMPKIMNRIANHIFVSICYMTCKNSVNKIINNILKLSFAVWR